MKAYYGSTKLFDKLDPKMVQDEELGFMCSTNRELAKNHSGENGFIYEVDLYLNRFASDGLITITSTEIAKLLDHFKLKTTLNECRSDEDIIRKLMNNLDKKELIDYCHKELKIDAIPIQHFDNTMEYVVFNKENVRIRRVEQLQSYVVDTEYVYINDKYRIDYTRFKNQVYFMDLGGEFGKRPGIVLYQNLKTDTALVVPFSSSPNRFYHNDPSTCKSKYPEHVYIPEMKGLALCERICPCRVSDIKGKWLGDTICLSDQTMMNVKEKINQLIVQSNALDINVGDLVILNENNKQMVGTIDKCKTNTLAGEEMNPVYTIKTTDGELLIRKKFDLMSSLIMHSKIGVRQLEVALSMASSINYKQNKI